MIRTFNNYERKSKIKHKPDRKCSGKDCPNMAWKGGKYCIDCKVDKIEEHSNKYRYGH